MTLSQPLISVIMPAYNAGEYLAEAIESILNQTCGDFELLLLDDGSTDNTREIALSYHDKRLRYLPNGRNLKLVATLNRGLDLARGRYIARMDADDVSLPERFERQVKFLEENIDIVCVGTSMRTLGLEKDYDVLYESRPEVVKVLLLFSCKIAHATTLIRSDFLKKYPLRYNPLYLHVEDFDFFHRMSLLGNICSVPEILYLRRVHTNQVCHVEKLNQFKTIRTIRKKIFSEIYPDIFRSEENFMFLESYFIDKNQPKTKSELKAVLSFFSDWLKISNNHNISSDILYPMLAKRCWDMCTNSSFNVHGLMRTYIKMGFLKWFNPGLINCLKLSLRGFLMHY